jgi:hypothetical protein
MKKEITNEYGCLVKLKTKLLVNINIEKILSTGWREVWCETGYLRIDNVVF